MWPIKNNNNVNNKDRLEIEILKIYEKFGTTILSSNWINEVFGEKTIALGASDLLINIAKCENCINYIGVNPILKKIKNIYVISGFCNFFNEGIKKPEVAICSFFDPKNIYKDIILLKLKEKFNINFFNEEY